MPCETQRMVVDGEEVIAIVCTRGGSTTPRKRCVVCGSERNLVQCAFELFGEKAGQRCDKRCCTHHIQGTLCPAHDRYVADKALPPPEAGPIPFAVEAGE